MTHKPTATTFKNAASAVNALQALLFLALTTPGSAASSAFPTGTSSSLARKQSIRGAAGSNNAHNLATTEDAHAHNSRSTTTRRSVLQDFLLPPPGVSLLQLQNNRNELVAILILGYAERGMHLNIAADSLQGRALDVVAGSARYSQLTDDQNVERFAAVAFHLSTCQQPHLLNTQATTEAWANSDKWLTDNDLCEWHGIQCNGGNYVVGIDLPNNKMSGTLPLELSLLENLAWVNFSSNYLLMKNDHHQLWSLLPNLQELRMDDNFVVSETGVPTQLAELSNIQHISLSNNLLQGQMDEGVFGSLNKLVHFEAESNRMTGTLPDDLLTLTNLERLHMSHNSFEAPLAQVFENGNLPSVSSLRLGANMITGTIPTGVGLFTSLVSLSLEENGQLTGSIPAELGELTNLEDLRLNDNLITGTIPATMGQLTLLNSLSLQNNDLAGSIPGSAAARLSFLEDF